MAIDDLTVAANQAGDLETELADRCARAVHGEHTLPSIK
jgi:hypothetical protein